MKKITGLLGIFLSASLALGATACTNSDNSNQTTTPTTKTGENPGTSDDNMVENEFGWVKPDETISFSVYAGYGDQEDFLADEKGGKAYFDKWLLDNMNVEIDWQFNSVDMNERLNLMLVTGDYPDVITWMTDEMANRFAEQGKAIDLTDLIEQYGDNITRRMGNYFNFLKNDEGKVMKLAQYWGENPNVPGSDFGIRYDYWLELGRDDIYKTPQEYFETVREVLKSHPTNDNGQQTYAFTSADKGANFMNAMLGAYGFINGYKVNDGDFVHWIDTDEGHEFASLVNEAYRTDLIDPDFLSNGYEEYITKTSSGQVIGNFGTWWYAWTGGHEIWAVDEGDNYDIAKRFMNVSVAGGGIDQDETSLLTSNFIGSNRTIITDNAADPEDIMRFINWQNSELGNFITGWGPPVESNVWEIAEDGTWRVDDAILDTDRKEVAFHNVRDAHGANIYPVAINMNWLKTDGLSNFDLIDPRVDRVSAYDYWPVAEDGSFANEGINLTWQFYKAPARDITLYQTTFNPNDQIAITNQSISDTVINEWAKMITAETPEAFETQFDTSKDILNALGVKDLAAYYQTTYESNLEVFGSN